MRNRPPLLDCVRYGSAPVTLWTLVACGSPPPAESPVVPFTIKPATKPAPNTAALAPTNPRAATSSTAASPARTSGAVSSGPTAPTGFGRRPTELGRLVVSNLSTCFLGDDRAIRCWSPAGLQRFEGPFLTLIDGYRALTNEGRLVEFRSMKEVEVDNRKLPPASRFVSLSRSYGQLGCAIRLADSTLECWGFERVPKGPFADIAPVSLEGSEGVCGLRPSGAIECFAAQEPSTELELPRALANGRYSQLGVPCSLLEDGTLSCFTDAAQGWVAKVPKLTRFYYMDYWNVCGLDTSGRAGCWGNTPREPVDRAYDYVGYTATRACGLIGGRVECWGRNLGGPLDPPPDIGSYVADRPYLVHGRPFNQPVKALPQSKLAGCTEVAMERAPADIQALGQQLDRVVNAPLNSVNLARGNEGGPVLTKCGSEYSFRWTFFVYGQTDYIVMLASSASLAKFDAEFKRARATHFREIRDDDLGKFTYAAPWRGGDAIMLWDRKRGSVSGSFDGYAQLRVRVGRFLVTEVTDAPSDARTTFNAHTGTGYALAKFEDSWGSSPSAGSSGQVDRELAAFEGAYPRDLLQKRPDVAAKLERALKGNKETFYSRFSVESKLQVAGDYLIAQGCRQRVCLPEQGMFVLNLKTGQLHAAVVVGSSPSGSRTFAEKDAGPVPDVLKRLMAGAREEIAAEFGGAR